MSPLLNYSTETPADRSIAEIQKCLAAHGAQAIMCEYDRAGNIEALSFRILMGDKPVMFRLPSDWKPVQRVLVVQREKMRKARKSHLPKTDDEQARRVSWRILKDWVEAQMALVELQMAEAAQVFLPYAVSKNGKTFFEYVKNDTNLLSAPAS